MAARGLTTVSKWVKNWFNQFILAQESKPMSPGNVVAIQRSRINEQLIRILLQRIVRGQYLKDDKLPAERALAAEFSVNRATVREALRYLETLELITIRQGDGAWVRDYRASSNLEVAKALMQVDDAMRIEVLVAVLEVRRMVSPEIAYAAALRRSSDQLQRLHAVVFKSPDLSIMARDRQVHHHIGQASGNLIYLLNSNFYEDFFDFVQDLYFADPKNTRRSQRFHQEIYTAIKKQNAGEARKIMTEVLVYAENAIFMTLKQQGRMVT